MADERLVAYEAERAALLRAIIEQARAAHGAAQLENRCPFESSTRFLSRAKTNSAPYERQIQLQRRQLIVAQVEAGPELA